jgi:hypothetical protein
MQKGAESAIQGLLNAHLRTFYPIAFEDIKTGLAKSNGADFLSVEKDDKKIRGLGKT